MSDPFRGESRPFGFGFWPLPEDDPGVESPREEVRIVTDDGAKPEELEDFRNAGIKVIVAKVTEEDEMKKLA